MGSRDDLQGQIDLTDFTRGISSGYHSSVGEQPQPDGFARDTETYGCFGLPNGGLAPLPTITFSRDGGDPATGYSGQKWPTEADGYPADYDERIAVLDAHVVSPVIHAPALGTAVDDTDAPVDLFTVRQWWMVTTDDTKVDTIFRFRGHPVWSGDTSNNFAPKDVHALAVRANWDPHPSRWKYGWGSIMETRTQPTDADVQTIGPPVVVAGMGTFLYIADIADELDEGVELGGYFSWPDLHTSNEEGFAVPVDDTYTLPAALGAALPGVVFGHQGRLCSIGRQSGYKFAQLLAYHGNNGGTRAASELVHYWPVNDIYNTQFQNATFLEEHSTGYGSWRSVNANSLLLVKNTGGAVQVNGDLDLPQVVRLPGVPSVGGLANRGAVADKGYVYGTASGVWIWAGGDVAEHVSPDLADDFWVPDDPTIPRRQLGQLVGSWAFRRPFVFGPNNWLLDMRTGGWFRYWPTPDQDPTNGTIFAYNEVDVNGDLWAVVPSYLLDTRFYAQFGQDSAQSKYVWRSQPLARSRGRMLKYRQVELVASGTGRVTVELFSLNETPQQVTFDVASDTAVSKVEFVSLAAKDVEVRITSEGGDADTPAPIVHRVSLGFRQEQSVARVGD